MIQTSTNLKHIKNFISEDQLLVYKNKIKETFTTIYEKRGAGNDFLGWTTLPSEMTKEFIKDIKDQAELLRKKSQVFVVVGIGGSYLGARAVIEAISHQFGSLLNRADDTQIVYAGHNMSEEYMVELLELLDQKDYSMAVISKSGTTTEPAVAFRILKNHLENKYGKEEARTRIVAITDKAKGALKTLANEEGYKTYIVPDNVGGRYSVLTPVGLLPIAVAGIDIEELVNGALAMETYCKENQNCDNVVAQYAMARQALYHDGKTNEILVSYEPRLHYIAEWWKQLYGESEGKEGKGIFPASDTFTTDLHSMGQYIQEGLRNLFETIISVEKPTKEIRIPLADNDLDQLNYIAGKRLSEVNRTAETATILAHVDGGVPNIIIQIPEISASTIGELIYFFEMGCALSGYMLEVNPFDQPGVEAYKKNMFALLGKKGFEERAEDLRKRIE
ncbi:MAG: glucose-6-phosphate isomerase [Lentimicrobiaceae bacterium]|nr:glucose-6-phosphate isomerase [Lentimicrobiaceae bacterium]